MSGQSPLDYARPGTPQGSRRAAVIPTVAGAVVVVGLIALATSLMALPPLGRSRETARRVRCAMNLRTIGKALRVYANANQGWLPQRFEDLGGVANLATDTFICPSSRDTPASSFGLLNGHLSYVYAGAGMRLPLHPNAIIAYEPASNHDGDGMCVLLGDDYVEFFNRRDTERAIADLTAGRNPPPWMVTPPAAAPATQAFNPNTP